MYALDGFLETIPERLVDNEARALARRAGRLLPDAFASALALEIRLDEDPRVDLCVLASTRRQFAILAGTDPVIRQPGAFGRGAYRTAVRMARRSLGLDRARADLSPWLWLEFDLANVRAQPAPGVFAVAGPAPGPVPGGDQLPLLGEMVETLTDGRISTIDPAFDVIRDVVAGGLVVRHIGCFGGRPGAPVRLVCDLPADDDSATVAALLSQAGWFGGDARDLSRWIRTCGTWGDHIFLHIDVAAGRRRAVGIDVLCARTPQSHEQPPWGGMLTTLTDQGLCTRAKRAAVEELTTSFTVNVMTRQTYRVEVYSVKVVVAPDGAARAKAYIMASC